MLRLSLTFLVIALIAALLGFGGLAVTFAALAKVMFRIFLILFIISFVMHVFRR